MKQAFRVEGEFGYRFAGVRNVAACEGCGRRPATEVLGTLELCQGCNQVTLDGGIPALEARCS